MLRVSVLPCQMESQAEELGNTLLDYLPLNHMHLKPQSLAVVSCAVSQPSESAPGNSRELMCEALDQHSCLASCI